MTATAVLTFIPKTKKTNTNNPFYFQLLLQSKPPNSISIQRRLRKRIKRNFRSQAACTCH